MKLRTHLAALLLSSVTTASIAHADVATRVDGTTTDTTGTSPAPDTTTDEGDSGTIEWTDDDDTDADFDDDLVEPGRTILYKVYIYGRGITTIAADLFFANELEKATAACAAAGGELKIGKPQSSGVYLFYKVYVYGVCLKK